MEAKPCVLVRDSVSGLNAHGADAKSAIASLRRKIAALARRNAPVTMDTVLTAAAYQRLTGACDEGTNAWLEEHGYTRKDRMTVRDLLEVLDDRDYGKRRILELVGGNDGQHD